MIHALTRPFALVLTRGNVADVTGAPELLARMGRTQDMLADTSYEADRLRRPIRLAGAVPVVPGRSTRKRQIRYDRKRYKDCNLIENAFFRLKDFRRVAAPLRQARPQFPIRRGARRSARVPAVNESGAQALPLSLSLSSGMVI